MGTSLSRADAGTSILTGLAGHDEGEISTWMRPGALAGLVHAWRQERPRPSEDDEPLRWSTDLQGAQMESGGGSQCPESVPFAVAYHALQVHLSVEPVITAPVVVHCPSCGRP